MLKFKSVACIAPMLLLVLFVGGVAGASAQGVSPYFGVGWASDGVGTSAGCAKGNLFDDFSNACEAGPTIGGTFGVFGADFMAKPHFGINGEYAFRFAQAPYLPVVGLNMRPSFYDFNAVWEPISGGRVVPVIEG